MQELLESLENHSFTLLLYIVALCLVLFIARLGTSRSARHLTSRSRKLLALSSLCAAILIIFIQSCQCGIKSSIVKNYSTEEIAHLLFSAENGDMKAQEELGRAYSFGNGVQKDNAKAVKWLTKSAEQGNTSVLFNLANIYEDGDDKVKQDFAQAYFWYSISIQRGDTFANSNRDSILKHLSKEQRQAQDQRAIDWQKKYPPNLKANRLN